MTRIPILLFHGLMVVRILLTKWQTLCHWVSCIPEWNLCIGQDSVSWVLGTPKESLGFILADGGFDVWFANTRGTNSSRNHTSLTPQDPVFISSLFKNTFSLGFFTNRVLTNIFRSTGIRRGTNLLPMIFLPCFSLSMITQEVRKSTISATPWWAQISLLKILMSPDMGLGGVYWSTFYFISREPWLFLQPSLSTSYYT